MNKIQVRRLLRRFGVDLCRRMPRVVDLLGHHGIRTVLDVGANAGQTGIHLRQWGYRGRIVSFEPVRSAFAELEKNAEKDPLWEAVNLGIGNRDGTAVINVSARTDFSSIRPALESLNAFHEGAAYVAQETIQLRRLDSILDDYHVAGEQLFVKVDTQGYEREVVEGARASLSKIKGFQLELSLTPLYEGEPTFLEVATLLEALGFRVALVEPVSYDSAFASLLQVDAFFIRD